MKATASSSNTLTPPPSKQAFCCVGNTVGERALAFSACFFDLETCAFLRLWPVTRKKTPAASEKEKAV